MTDIPESNNALPIGYRLENYQIQRVLGEDSLGITYLAQAIQQHTLVAIKEYLPKELAVRESPNTIQVIPWEADNFAWGLKRFIKEAQNLILAQFRHPNLVPILHSFQAHDTFYVVMGYEQGPNLADVLQAGNIPTQAELMQLLSALLAGLETLHQKGYLHRDIKPTTIFLAEPKLLLNFGAVRYALSNHCQNMTTIVTPGYTAFEQYQTDSNLQGAWTDIYSLGAVLYRIVSGKEPPEATERIVALMRNKPDPLTAAVETGAGNYHHHFLAAIDWALTINEPNRPPNVEAWRNKLFNKQPHLQSTPSGSAISEPVASTVPPTLLNRFKRFAIGMGVIFLLTLLVAESWWLYQEREARLQAEAIAKKVHREPEIATAEIAKRELVEITATEPAREERLQEATTRQQLELEAHRQAEAAEKTRRELELATAKQVREKRLQESARTRSAIAQAQLPNGPLRIMTGAGVRLRQALRQNAKGSRLLQIGTIVSELDNAYFQGEIWYQIETPDHKVGWVHGKYTLALVPEERAQAYIQVAEKKLNSHHASFGDLVDLYNFLSRASNEVKLETAVELKLLRLLTLQHTLDKIPINQQDELMYAEWINKNHTDIRYETTQFRWLVKKELFQQLYDKYSFLPIAERILQSAESGIVYHQTD